MMVFAFVGRATIVRVRLPAGTGVELGLILEPPSLEPIGRMATGIQLDVAESPISDHSRSDNFLSPGLTSC